MTSSSIFFSAWYTISRRSLPFIRATFADAGLVLNNPFFLTQGLPGAALLRVGPKDFPPKARPKAPNPKPFRISRRLRWFLLLAIISSSFWIIKVLCPPDCTFFRRQRQVLKGQTCSVICICCYFAVSASGNFARHCSACWGLPPQHCSSAYLCLKVPYPWGGPGQDSISFDSLITCYQSNVEKVKGAPNKPSTDSSRGLRAVIPIKKRVRPAVRHYITTRAVSAPLPPRFLAKARAGAALFCGNLDKTLWPCIQLSQLANTNLNILWILQ